MGSLPRSPEQELKEFTELLHQSNLDGPFLLVSHSYGRYESIKKNKPIIYYNYLTNINYII